MSTTAKIVCVLVVVAVGAMFVTRAVSRPETRRPLGPPPSGMEGPVEDAPTGIPAPRPITPRPFDDERETATGLAAHEPALLPRNSAQSFVTGRLVGEDGAPFTSRWITATEYSRSDGRRSSHGTHVVDLDQDGRFRIQLTEPFRSDAGDANREIVFHALPRRSFGTTRPTEPASGARVDLSRDLPAGDSDLGSVVVKLAPLIAAGIVVDPTGRSVSGAGISLHPGDSAESRRTFAELRREMDRLQQLAVDSTSDGSFEVRGFVDGPSVTVWATKEGWNDSERRLAQVGDQGLRLVLGEQGGAFKGKVLVDASVPISLIVIEYHPSAAPGGLAFSVTDRCEPDGSFEYKSRGPETLRIVVGAVGVDESLADVAGIVLRAGETTHDPRLDPLDLRGRLRVMKVAIVDGDAEPVPNATVFVEPSPEARSEYGIDATDGTASLLTTRTAIDLRVEAAGYRTVRIRGVTTDARVAMRPSLRASFTFEGQLPRLPADVTPKVTLILVGEKTAEGREDEAKFVRQVLEKGGHVRTQVGSRASVLRTRIEIALDSKWFCANVPIPEPGPFEVELLLEQKLESGSYGFHVPYATPPRVTVSDQDEAQAIVCPAPPRKEIEKILRQLKE